MLTRDKNSKHTFYIVHISDATIDKITQGILRSKSNLRFLPCDCNLALAVVRCLSVWLAGWVSVTFVYCVETTKDTTRVSTECE